MEWIFLSLFAVSFGSFFNILISRVPYGNSINGRSKCPKCKSKILWYHNIPIISWMILKGRCAYCDKKISIQYPIVEILTLIIFISIFHKNGFNIDSIIISFVLSLFLVLSIIDYQIQAVPDSINLATLSLAIFIGDIPTSIVDALICAGGFSLLRYYVSFIIQKEAMGEGDIIIAGSMGALIGTPNVLIAIFLSSIIALPFAYIANKNNLAIPYIPFLAVATFITYFFDLDLIILVNRIYG